MSVSYTHLRAHETPEHLVCRLLLEKKKLENVAIANALQLEAARRRAVLIRFNSSPVSSLNSPSLSAAVLERFYCLYVTLRCDLEL